jgi:hypothetical protein
MSTDVRRAPEGTGQHDGAAHRLLERARNLVWLGVALAGLIMVVGGGYAVFRGMDARDEVRSQLEVQNIVTPEDASIPNEQVRDVATARAMADIIGTHANEATGGLTYSEMGRFMTEDGDPAGTDDPEEAVTSDNGSPLPNPARNTAFQASALQTSLYTSVMAFEVSTLVTGLGLAFIGLGLATWLVGVPLVWTVTRKLS